LHAGFLIEGDLEHRGVARISVWGGTGPAPKARDEDRGAENAEGWGVGKRCPLPTGSEVWEGAVPHPQKIF